jgi:hypothetical protein
MKIIEIKRDVKYEIVKTMDILHPFCVLKMSDKTGEIGR